MAGLGSLRYAGKVGTGYDRRTLELLHQRLAPLHRPNHRSRAAPCRRGGIQWVTPKLVAEIGFSEWTTAGLLRHPRFIGLRDDKPAKEVRREGVATWRRAPGDPFNFPHSPDLLVSFRVVYSVIASQ